MIVLYLVIRWFSLNYMNLSLTSLTGMSDNPHGSFGGGRGRGRGVLGRGGPPRGRGGFDVVRGGRG